MYVDEGRGRPRRRACHGAARAAIRALLAAVALLGVGCSYEARLDPCGVACRSSESCPAGWSCVDRLCRPRAEQAACTQAAVDGAVPDAAADTRAIDGAADGAPPTSVDGNSSTITFDASGPGSVAVQAFGGCYQAGDNRSDTHKFDTQAGQFTVVATVTPSAAPVKAGGFGLSRRYFEVWGDAAAVVMFHLDGSIKVRQYVDTKNSTYAADTDVRYAANAPYRIRMAIDVPARKYSAWVTPPNGAEVPLARAVGFSAGFETSTFLDHWAIHAEAGSVSACNIQFSVP